jgi:muramoyltetrapeptide carboxypeptidase
MNRREFQQKIALGLPLFSMGATTTAPNNLFPKKLQPGDTVGLITPGSYLSDDGLKKAVDNMISLGLKVKMGKNIRAKRGFNAGTDQQRLDDLHLMFADDQVDAIWCARGGYGCTRLLPHIDYQLIQDHPKVLVGYSDITALLNAIYLKTGLVGFHGPVGASTFTPYTLTHLKALLFEGASQHTIKPAEEYVAHTDVNYHPKTIRAGKATGSLIGGNLSLLSAMAGTSFLPDLKGKIVFIEEIGEKPYRIDRMLTQLRQAWSLKEAAALAIGVMADCEADPDDHSLTLLETITDRTADLGIPVVYGLSFGHIDHQCTLPVGINATLDTVAHTLQYREAAVRSIE